MVTLRMINSWHESDRISRLGIDKFLENPVIMQHTKTEFLVISVGMVTKNSETKFKLTVIDITVGESCETCGEGEQLTIFKMVDRTISNANSAISMFKHKLVPSYKTAFNAGRFMRLQLPKPRSKKVKP